MVAGVIYLGCILQSRKLTCKLDSCTNNSLKFYFNCRIELFVYFLRLTLDTA